jgi:hypothetical protein
MKTNKTKLKTKLIDNKTKEKWSAV